jgi:hypothetical protein
MERWGQCSLTETSTGCGNLFVMLALSGKYLALLNCSCAQVSAGLRPRCIQGTRAWCVVNG